MLIDSVKVGEEYGLAGRPSRRVVVEEIVRAARFTGGRKVRQAQVRFLEDPPEGGTWLHYGTFPRGKVLVVPAKMLEGPWATVERQQKERDAVASARRGRMDAMKDALRGAGLDRVDAQVLYPDRMVIVAAERRDEDRLLEILRGAAS